jgi:hypothetical protein
MAFAHTGMTLQPMKAQHLRADETMADIWLCTIAVDAWRIAAYDADVVEHRCLDEKGTVER